MGKPRASHAIPHKGHVIPPNGAFLRVHVDVASGSELLFYCCALCLHLEKKNNGGQM
uniref:Uncharacterized protein n=1 Tax=Nelumbo nucifera TaxID=4432 RepID=A0A822YH28_NELNU|nr:TPA_asm: hypothetical protein HUJ06_010284 [Nelumbo nucifera]